MTGRCPTGPRKTHRRRLQHSGMGSELLLLAWLQPCVQATRGSNYCVTSPAQTFAVRTAVCSIVRIILVTSLESSRDDLRRRGVTGKPPTPLPADRKSFGFDDDGEDVDRSPASSAGKSAPVASMPSVFPHDSIILNFEKNHTMDLIQSSTLQT